MKLIIEINKEIYEEIKCDEACGLHELTRAIANGIPLDEDTDKEYVTSLDEAKKIFNEALQKSDTSIEWFKNILNEAYKKGYEDGHKGVTL